jgi:hypothetical protein
MQITLTIFQNNYRRNHMMKKILCGAVLLLAMAASAAVSQGKFSGYMFGDYYYNITRDANFSSLSNSAISSAAPGGTAMQAFQLRRIYFAYDNDISEQFTTRFRLEVDQAASPTGTTAKDVLSGGKIAPFVKDAYLMWKNVFEGSNLIFGMQPTPAYDVSESAWGYRSIEKTIMDMRSIVDSRDLGISLKGKITSDGMFNYWVMVGNGAGTSAPETDKYKRYYAHIQVKPMTNLQLTAYADYKDAADVAGKSQSSMTEALFVGYAVPFSYSLGVEGFLSSKDNGYTPTGSTNLDTKTTLGFTVYGTYNILPELTAIVRYDSFDPNDASDNAAKGDSRNYVIAGLSWKVDKNVSIQPNILYETYETPVGGNSIDASLTGRLTLYYVFL